MLKAKAKWMGLAVFAVLMIVLAVYFVGQRTVVEVPKEMDDIGGRTIQVSAPWGVAPVAGTQGGERALLRLAELQEKYNVTIEWLIIPWEIYTKTLAASVLAGDPMADKVLMPPDWLYTSAMRGLLQPLEKFYDLNNPMWDSSALEFGTIDGRTYGIKTGKPLPPGVFFFNKTIFEREGLPNLYELVENRQWTWDKMIEIAKQATRDLDSDGVIDQWGIGGMRMFLPMIYSNMGSIIEIIDDRPTLKIGEPAAMEALQVYFDIIHTHKVFDIPPIEARDDWASIRFKDGKTAMFAYSFYIGSRFAEGMSDDYGITLFPMGPRATEHISVSIGPDSWTMPVGVENPEQVTTFWESWVAPFSEDLEDPDYWVPAATAYVRDEESLNTLRYIWEHNIIRTSLVRAFSDPLWGSMLNMNLIITYEGFTPAMLAEQYLTPLQTAIDDAIDALKAQ